jgi:hypothetical protein
MEEVQISAGKALCCDHQCMVSRVNWAFEVSNCLSLKHSVWDTFVMQSQSMKSCQVYLL